MASLGKKAGDIPLSNAVVEANPANPYGRTHLFGIKPAGQTRIYVVEAPTAAMKEEWIRTIRAVGDKPSLYPGSVREGFMFKVGGNVKSWKNRYFVLTKDKLLYYAAPKDKKPKGDIPLEKGALLASETPEAAGKPFAFSVSPTGMGRKYMLQATGETDRNEWMAAIRQVATASR